MNLRIACVFILGGVGGALPLTVRSQVTNQASSLRPETVIAASKLESDVSVLRKAFEALHPGLYRYHDKEDIDAAFDRLGKDLDHDQTLASAFLRLTQFTAYIRCGHTWPSFFNQSKVISSALFETVPRLPFYWVWIDGQKMIVTRDFTSGRVLPAGTEILSVNGVSSRNLLAKLLPLARADGANDAKRIDQMSVQGFDTLEAPDVYLPLLFPDWGSQFKVVIRQQHQKQAKTIAVEGVTVADRIKERNGILPDMSGPGPLFQAKTLDSGALWLRMPDWAVFNSKWDWKQWLNKTLEDAMANRVPALIIDLRGNEGGLDEIGDALLDHLRTAPLAKQTKYVRLVRYRSMPDELRPYLSTWDKSILDWGEDVEPMRQPWPTAPPVTYFHRVDAEETPQSTTGGASRPFAGKVIVLIDASNSSSTFNCARVVQQEHLGLLVGQATGGSLRGINGGAFVFLKLPGSGIEIDLPLVGTFPDEQQPDRGLKPNVVVRANESDIKAGRDRTLEVAEALVRTRS